MNPEDIIEKHFTRLKSEQKRALHKLGIRTIRDLLYHFPSRYEHAGQTGTIAGASAGAEVILYGTVRKPEIRKTWKSRRPVAEAWLEDASGKIKMMWFSQPYIAKTLHDGMSAKVSGRVAGMGAKVYLANPSIGKSPVNPYEIHSSLFGEHGKVRLSQTMGESDFPKELCSIYPESRGVSSLWLLYALKKVFEAQAHERLKDPIPPEILARYNLPTLSSAFVFIHTPKKLSDATVARKRFAFEEVFALQIVMQQRRRVLLTKEALPVVVDRSKLADFVASFPFPATKAQMNAIDVIASDFEKTRPMLRLLEGDVGSGKTAVAAATAYLVATSLPKGRVAGTLQVAYLCPTEILAKQHFSTFVSYFRGHHIPVGLITGNECRKFPSRVRYEESVKLSKVAFKKMVANGEIPIVIGTHALIEKSLSFKYFAYAIIDEQHRFGTMHRQKLATKGNIAPHLLSMTATPIPRTLALALYGDLDLTLLDEMPAGRKSILTRVLAPERREDAYERVRVELALGHQAYVICPRIDEPDPAKELALIAKSVKAEAARLKKEVFPNATIGILHSKMKPSEKEGVMKKFEDGDTNILVATSVVEVGVNVPNATIILIEGAERFGLAQLHQLRGRVIRSTHQSYCFALPESFGEITRERMRAFASAKNGFELAEYDLALRGAGELGVGKQWGVSDIAMEALKNIKLVEAARAEAANLVAADPDLKNHPALTLRAATTDKEMHLE
ncbi:DNA helicase RecG [Candidatus Kaiserbacteria bacterium CG_4_9_14_3_um_filter_50_16]|nr:MAG: DNA helicase RecG [Candidatus Kaiserbacteria bacterium CG_4_8_14_3_um_filter_50_23]PJA94416.1 MAG: DNA helicase RecG [Candidatus Kaiserbacteria bacterium CG_4_9_14_3_um_filter_50_16]